MNLIISLEQKYFDLMFAGKKRFEFRRKFVNTPCNAFIYVPYPVCEIQGYVEFNAPIIDTPSKINLLALSQGISEDNDVLDYLSNLDRGWAMPVKRVIRFKTPISLSYLRTTHDFFAPQSYVIVDRRPELLKELLIRLKDSTEDRIFDLSELGLKPRAFIELAVALKQGDKHNQRVLNDFDRKSVKTRVVPKNEKLL